LQYHLILFQFGIAFFEKELEKNKYAVNSYNIYVYGVAFDFFAKRELLGMQISCLNFLAQNNFDFNKVSWRITSTFLKFSLKDAFMK